MRWPACRGRGRDDIEILIVGDGVDDALRSEARRLQADDWPHSLLRPAKGPRHGEVHRDWVLRQARGRIVCYQSDDDLWLPGHLEAMAAALEDADFVGAMQVNVDTDDRVRCHFFDLERVEFTEPWLEWTENGFGAWACNGFGLSFAAHRLEAYLRLPEGWATTPPGLPTDQFMWHKFARQPWCRLKSVPWPVALHFPSPDRRDWEPQRRAAELKRWSEIVADPTASCASTARSWPSWASACSLAASRTSTSVPRGSVRRGARRISPSLHRPHHLTRGCPWLSPWSWRPWVGPGSSCRGPGT